MPEHYYISEELQETVYDFFTQHNMQLLSSNLRHQFIDYLDYGLDTGVPLYFDEFLFTFNCLLDLLDKAATEINAFELASAKNKTAIHESLSIKDKVIAFLTASLSPEKIFLLHHSIAQDNTEHFDFLVVLPESNQTSFSAYEEVISMANIEQAHVNVSLHKAATLYKQLEEGHLFYSIVCNKENLVYDDGLSVLPRANKMWMQTAIEKANAVFLNSCKKAGSFLQTANDYCAANDTGMAAFMLHQSIELLLRGLITALLGSCTKTHCFKELKKPLKRCAPELQYLVSAGEAEENRLLHLLEKAYLESRYSDAFEISNRDIELIKAAAEKLQEQVKKLLEAKLKMIAV